MRKERLGCQMLPIRLLDYRGFYVIVGRVTSRKGAVTYDEFLARVKRVYEYRGLEE